MDSNNLGNTEFSRLPTETKYFHNKAKLVVNAKAQLNNFVKATGDTSIEVALLLIESKVNKSETEIFLLALYRQPNKV